MNKTKVAINGFGRIGRITLRKLIDHKYMEVVAINDLADTETLAHLFKYDSVHGTYKGEVSTTEKSITIENSVIQVLSIKDPTELPWKEMGVEIVLECTGLFRREEDAEKHLEAGAKKVIISAPSKGETYVKTIVIGVNDDDLDENDEVISNASCTTNCLAPVMKVIEDNWGFQKAFMTTVHAYTSDQSLHDRAHRDLRRARAASRNLVPTTTGAADALSLVMPQTKGKVMASAVRVPVIDGSTIELNCILNKEVSEKEINAAFKKAAEQELKGILEYTEAPLVSSDIIGNSHSAIFDASLTTTMGSFVKLMAWYDNEMGYSSRLVDLIQKSYKIKIMGDIHAYDFSNKQAVIRVDFNVPLDDSLNVTDDTRIQAALPTIEKILKDNGSVVLMSHLGRPKDGPEEKFSLKHLVPHLTKLFSTDVLFAEDCASDEAFRKSQNLKAGEVLLLENLRFYKEETKGDKAFAEKLSQHGDVYINDAFGTAHRAHASTAIIADFFKPEEKMFGCLMEKEIKNAEKVLKDAKKTFYCYFGWCKNI